MPTAAIVIIGNEILSGKFADENGPYLIGRLRTLGVDLHRLAVIPDLVPVIASEVRAASEAFDHVFTTGGVGPTHDDVTFEGIAAAFGMGLRLDPDLSALLDHFGMERTEAVLRMVRIPEGAELMTHDMTTFPVVKVRNVFVFPGVPRLLRQKFELVAPHIASEAVRCVRIFARDHETAVAQAISDVAAAFPTVEIGSYPRFGEGEHKLIVTLEGRDDQALRAASDRLTAALDVVAVEGTG